MTRTTTKPGPIRSDAGTVRLGQRDIDGLLLCAEHGGAPYDLLAAALGVEPARLRAIVARWRRAGYAATGLLGPGPAWCWLTPAGMAACGLPYPAARPPLAGPPVPGWSATPGRPRGSPPCSSGGPGRNCRCPVSPAA